MNKNYTFQLCISLLFFALGINAEVVRYTFAAPDGPISGPQAEQLRLIYTASDMAGGLNAEFVVTVPTEVCLNQPFDIYYAIRNSSPTGFTYFPVQWSGLMPNGQNVSYISNTPPTTGTFNPSFPSLLDNSGTGAWLGPTGLENLRIDGNSVANLTVTMVATSTGPDPKTWNSSYKINDPIQFGPFTIMVLDIAPTASGISLTACDNTPLNISVLDFASACSPFILTGASGPSSNGGTVVIESNGTITYTPASGYTGPDSFVYTIQDSSGNSASGTVGITVIPCTPSTICPVPVS